jgi:uncharacterized protein
MSDQMEPFEAGFVRGVELFNQKAFFECHDIFEDLWHLERGERRLFLQGLIQAAVGCYHLSNGNTTGAVSQYTKSLAKLETYPGSYLGIDVARLVSELQHCLAGATAMAEQGARYEVDDSYFPQLHHG